MQKLGKDSEIMLGDYCHGTEHSIHKHQPTSAPLSALETQLAFLSPFFQPDTPTQKQVFHVSVKPGGLMGNSSMQIKKEHVISLARQQKTIVFKLTQLAGNGDTSPSISYPALMLKGSTSQTTLCSKSRLALRDHY